jgi:hypothetical protein
MTMTLASLQTAFKGPDRNFASSNYYPFHLMAYDAQAIVRFLPDKNLDNPKGFLVEKIVHELTINGNRRSVPCLEQFGEDCPICAVSQQFYRAYEKSKNENDKENGKKYWKKRKHLGQVLVIKDPVPADETTGETHKGKVRLITIGFQLFGVIKSAIGKGHFAEDVLPYSYIGGYNFYIEKQKQGDYPNYTIGSCFAANPSDLSPEQISMVEEEIIDLSTALPPNPGIEKVEALLNSAITGEEYVDPTKESNLASSFAKQVASIAAKNEAAAEKEAAKKEAAKKEAVEEEVKSAPNVEKHETPTVRTSEVEKYNLPVTEEDDASFEAEKDDILARIRNRRKQKSSE